MSEIMFVNWERCPAVIVGPRAWAVVARGEGWKEVNEAEVTRSGGLLSRKRFEARFARRNLPPLPREAIELAEARVKRSSAGE